MLKVVRTTLDIDDEILLTVKQIAQQRKTTAGSFKPEYRNGVPLLPRRPNGPVVTAELVYRLASEDE